MKALFDRVSYNTTKMVTKTYSTSFTLGILGLDKFFHNPIYGIYGFVRLADEIVDSFHDYDKEYLMEKFRSDTYEALDQKISLNPVLNHFQEVVHEFNIPLDLIDTFLKSMEMDLNKLDYNNELYEQYILGSAEVVGLMCLKVFVRGDEKMYVDLKPNAMALGSAFQKINFLRDLNDDYEGLGRTYFPGIDLQNFTCEDKAQIENEIEHDFKKGFEGIKALPKGARFGVYIAYVYYYALLQKIKRTQSSKLFNQRIRIPNNQKYGLFFSSYLRHSLNLL